MSEFYPTITRPLRGARAFKEVSETASQPQAAILLMLARQLRGDDESLVARAKATRSARRVSAASPGSEDFPVPKLKASRQALASAEVRRRTQKMFGFSRALQWQDMERAFRSSAERLYATSTVDSAAELMEMCLAHPRQLVRIAAAHAYLPLTDNPARCIRILVAGVRSADRLEAELAATALARVQPEHPALRRLSRRGARLKRVRRKPETIMLVHGTWASDAEWYKPGGSFHTFIKGMRPDLYSQPDFFRWSGGYSDGARNQGALDLKAWVAGHNESGLDLMGHSHGANVMMQATKFGMTAGKLILLSCPVHVNKYFPNRAAGRRLVAGLSSSDEESRQIAGMLLVKAGARAEPLLAEELRQPRNLPHLLRVIGDAAPKAFVAELERYAASDDELVRQAAHDALRSAAAAARS